jgi:hypothetical protein
MIALYFQNNWDGGFGIQGQDHDGAAAQPATRTITISGVNISGYSTLQATIDFGALDSEPAFTNFETVDGDKFYVFATVHAGPRKLIGSFAPLASGAATHERR